MNQIQEEILKRENNNRDNLLIGGDFNARIGKEGGIINTTDGSVYKRNSKDTVINAEGERLIKFVEDNGWTILNGNMTGDEEGQWTYIGPNRESVIDYGVVNEKARGKNKKLQSPSRN